MPVRMVRRHHLAGGRLSAFRVVCSLGCRNLLQHAEVGLEESVQCWVVKRSQIYLVDLASKGIIHEELGFVVKYPGDRHVRVLVDAAGLFEEPLHIRKTIEASRIA